MALMRGKLFAGALFAGALLGGQIEQIPVEQPIRGLNIVKPYAQHIKLEGNTWQIQKAYGIVYAQHEQYVAPIKTFAFANTAQEQAFYGSITHRNVPESVPLVSAYLHANAITAQSQSLSGNVTQQITLETESADGVPNVLHSQISTAQTEQQQQSKGNYLQEKVIVSAIAQAITYQQQMVSGSVTTNDDEMLMVLLAMLESDSV